MFDFKNKTILMKPNLNTVVSWEQALTIEQILDKLYDCKPQYPSSPIKPILSEQHTKEDILIYAEKFGKYEIQLNQYEIDKANFKEDLAYIADLTKAYILYVTNFNALVPLKVQEKVWNKACRKREYGWYDVYLELIELIAIVHELETN